jgi:hypothetical protein
MLLYIHTYPNVYSLVNYQGVQRTTGLRQIYFCKSLSGRYGINNETQDIEMFDYQKQGSTRVFV